MDKYGEYLRTQRLVAEKDKEWENIRMITSILKDLTVEIPGRAAPGPVEVEKEEGNKGRADGGGLGGGLGGRGVHGTHDPGVDDEGSRYFERRHGSGQE